MMVKILGFFGTTFSKGGLKIEIIKNNNINNITMTTIQNKCSFCCLPGHQIRYCMCDEAIELHTFLNVTLFEMRMTEQRTLLNAYRVRELKMMSVIMDLKILPTKLEMIENIVECIFKKKVIILALLRLQKTETNVVTINKTLLDKERQNETLDCPICLSSCAIDKTYATNCGHSFCVECMDQYLVKNANHNCPMCRTKVNSLELKELGLETNSNTIINSSEA